MREEQAGGELQIYMKGLRMTVRRARVKTGFHIVNDSHPRTVGSRQCKYRSFIKCRPPPEQDITSHNGGFSPSESLNDSELQPRPWN